MTDLLEIEFWILKQLKGFFPTSLEEKIVSDADMCDALGSNEILRVYTYNIKMVNLSILFLIFLLRSFVAYSNSIK